MGNNFNKHVVVVGSARSGTSWLSELMAQPFRYRMLFEPDQETRTKRGHLLCDRWLRSPTDSKEAYTYLKAVFKNRVDCDWIAQNSNRKWKRHLWPFVPKKYIIKFVRCNLSAPFIHNEFGIPVIHLIRNPYDVIQSQLRANFPWLVDFKYYLSQPTLIEYLKDRYEINLKDYNDLSRIQILCLRWCIENEMILSLTDLSNKKYMVLKYEDLIKDIETYYTLCDKLNLEIKANIEAIYKQPSSKTHKNSVVRTKQEKTNIFTIDELKEINTILDVFESKLYPQKFS
ncbi:sulfotransferase domain-containing protein [Xanthomarina gelatinilytica]|uniref:sulfotransferase domain-containing protein n=1 Tax=Xanthomarina gelatinilytica TaxID=1137281 RepID=UPI003AA88203